MSKMSLTSIDDTFKVRNKDYFLVLEPNGDTLKVQFNAGNGWKDKPQQDGSTVNYTTDDIVSLPVVGDDVDWRVNGISAGTATLIY